MEEDGSWVFDSLVCFLNGPIWNAPLQSFIEEKSLIFEPNMPENEEYQKIFDEFKNLVDFMLGNFMEDIGISPEQFEVACEEGKRYQISFDHNLFEQIWAANDYEMFKRMMTQRNVELQLQALELIEQRYGITPQSFTLSTKEKENVRETPVIVEKTSDYENEVMDEVKKNFADEEPSTSELEVKNILEEKKQLEKTLMETKGNKVSIPDNIGEPSQKLLEEKIEKLIENEQNATKKPINFIHEETTKPIIQETKSTADNQDNEKKTNEIDAIELKKRQEYLRAQRDKLVALKKEERRKRLDVENGSSMKTRNRPKSAKAAELVMAGEKPNVEPQQLLIRKTLAERLRSEVVGKETK